MRKRSMMATMVCGLLVAAAQFPAHATMVATVDTFDFTQGGWAYAPGFGTSIPAAELTGSFTGTVDPTGRIELADLTSFSVTLGNTGLPSFTQGLGQLTLFSYDLNGGASSLDFAGPGYCVGAAVTLDANCALVTPPVSAKGSASSPVPAFSSDLPTITLVSSVTPAAAPEIDPASAFAALTLLAGCLLVLRGTRRRPGAVSG